MPKTIIVPLDGSEYAERVLAPPACLPAGPTPISCS